MKKKRGLPYTIREDIDPAKAQEWLDNYNRGNRNIMMRHVHHLAKLVKMYGWALGHNDQICRVHDGRLLNGQHRLMAVVMSGVTWVHVAVQYDTPEEAFSSMDSMQIAKDAHVRFPEFKTGGNVAIAKMVVGRGQKIKYLDEADLLGKFLLMEEAVGFADWLRLKKGPDPVPGCTKAAIFAAMARAVFYSEDKWLIMFNGILKGEVPEHKVADQGAIVLRGFLTDLAIQRVQVSSRMLYQLTETCLDVFISRKRLRGGRKKLQPAVEELFPLKEIDGEGYKLIRRKPQ